jgi:DNA-binding transcriptional ArsR family regulator
VRVDDTLRALAHPERRRMVALVRDRELMSGELASLCGLSRPAASQQLRTLRDAGLVTCRTDGTRRLYRARAGALDEVRRALDDFWAGRGEALTAVAEAEQRRRDLE